MATPRSLDEADLLDDPIAQLASWYDVAVAEGMPQPDAMTLATATPDGVPSARVVLLKGIDARGLRFFTNERSHKGRELEANPNVALVLLWLGLERQVRVTGRAQRLDAAESDAYFAGRPRGSQLGAWASQQSEPVADRGALEATWAELEDRYDGADVPRPPHWGGYLVVPSAFEFWQGRRDRLHDRFRYVRAADGWGRARLQP